MPSDVTLKATQRAVQESNSDPPHAATTLSPRQSEKDAFHATPDTQSRQPPTVAVPKPAPQQSQQPWASERSTHGVAAMPVQLRETVLGMEIDTLPHAIKQCIIGLHARLAHAVPGSSLDPEASKAAYSEAKGIFDFSLIYNWITEGDAPITSMTLCQTLNVQMDAQGKYHVELYIITADVDPSHQRRGLCAAIVGEEAAVLQQQLGTQAKIDICLNASGIDGPKIGRVFWGKLGAEFNDDLDRIEFLVCCVEWGENFIKQAERTADIPSNIAALKVIIAQLRAQKGVAEELAYKYPSQEPGSEPPLPVDALAPITAPWILFSMIQAIDSEGQPLMKDLEAHMMGDSGVSWEAVIRIQPQPEINPFWDRVAEAQKRRAAFAKEITNAMAGGVTES